MGIFLQPGESETVTFSLDLEDFGFIGIDDAFTVESGLFLFFIEDKTIKFKLRSKYDVDDSGSDSFSFPPTPQTTPVKHSSVAVSLSIVSLVLGLLTAVGIGVSLWRRKEQTDILVL